MLFPIIRIKDKNGKRQRIVGTDIHDCLNINEDGNIYYLNLQCLDHTGKNGGYEFIGEKDEFTLDYLIEFVSFEKLIDIYKKETKRLTNEERMLIDRDKKWELICIKKNRSENEDYIFNATDNID